MVVAAADILVWTRHALDGRVHLVASFRPRLREKGSCSRPQDADRVAYAQPAAEKAKKGFLGWQHQPFRKTPDLVEVGRQGVAIDATLEPLLRRAESMTVYALAFRCQGDGENPTVEETQGTLAIAREVVEAMLALLPADIPN